jgi:hypothetical protein
MEDESLSAEPKNQRNEKVKKLFGSFESEKILKKSESGRNIFSNAPKTL